MDHGDHVRLLRDGVRSSESGRPFGRVWADLGSGTGAFTLALADLLGPDGTVYSIDRDAGALRQQAREVAARFPRTVLRQTVADFTSPLALPPLDGAVMANSLHFVMNKLPVLALVREYLKPGGRLVLVEYDADSGNHWVPYPMTFETWRGVAEAAGFRDTRRLATVPSRFLGAIYSAASVRP